MATNIFTYEDLLKRGRIINSASNDQLLGLGVKSPDGEVLPALISIERLKASLGGGASITEGTYAEIKALKDSGSLTKGGKYLITDFQTKHYIADNVINQFGNGLTLVTGEVEPLIIEAASESEFTGLAVSTTNPSDTIVYEFDNFDIYQYWFDRFGDSQDAWNQVRRTPWVSWGADKGYITFRRDERIRVSTYYDWRVFKFRRWGTPSISGLFTEMQENANGFADFLTFYNRSELYNISPDFQVIDTSIGSYRQDGILIANNTVFGCVPDLFSQTGYISMFENQINGLYRNSFVGPVFYQNYIDAQSFEDNKMITPTLDITNGNVYGNLIQGGNISNNKFGPQVSNNTFINSNIQSNEFLPPPSQPTQVCNFSENTFIRTQFTGNTFASQSCTGNEAVRADIGNNNIQNPRFRDNTINGTFYNNIINGSNVIAGFQYNTIKDNAQMFSCTITMNTTAASFQYNIIETRDLQTIDFGSSTGQHVRQFTYNKKLTTQIDGADVLQYTDATGAIVTVSPTA